MERSLSVHSVLSCTCQAFAIRARRVCGAAFGEARDAARTARQHVAAVLADEWQQLQADVSNAVVARDLRGRRARRTLRAEVDDLRTQVASECEAVADAHAELADAQAKWAADLATALEGASARMQVAVDEKEEAAHAELQVGGVVCAPRGSV